MKLYTVYGSIGTATNAFKPYRIAVDTCSGYNIVRKNCLPPDWRSYEVPNTSLPRLVGAESSPLKLTSVVGLAVRLANVTNRLPFIVADALAVDVVLGTSFIDTHVRSSNVEQQRLDLRLVGGAAIDESKGVAMEDQSKDPPRKKAFRRTKNDNGRETDAQPRRLAKWATIPAMLQLAVRVTTKGSGLVFIEPKSSLQHRHGVRLTNSVADVMPDRTFDVIVANFFRRPRRLPKHTVLGYAKHNSMEILTPERRVAEEMGRVLNISTLPMRDQRMSSEMQKCKRKYSRWDRWRAMLEAKRRTYFWKR